MLNRDQPAPFVIVGDAPGGALAVPASSARAVAHAARHLTEYCPHTSATWQVSPHAGTSPVVVFGCIRSPAGEQLLDQVAHAFLLALGEALPLVWVALCGHQIGHTEFEALDPGIGQPSQGCHLRQAAPHHQHSSLPLRSPGEHMHPQLRRPPLAGSHGGGSA